MQSCAVLPDGNGSTFTCETDTGILIWGNGSNTAFYTIFSGLGDPPKQLGNFTVRLTMIGSGNDLTSTATVNVSSLHLTNSTNINIICRDGMSTTRLALLINGVL